MRRRGRAAGAKEGPTSRDVDVKLYFDACQGDEGEGPEAYYKYVEDHDAEGNAGRRERGLDIMQGRFCPG